MHSEAGKKEKKKSIAWSKILLSTTPPQMLTEYQKVVVCFGMQYTSAVFVKLKSKTAPSLAISLAKYRQSGVAPTMYQP